MSQIVGNELKQAREKRGDSLNEVSEKLFIRITYLQALENGRSEIIPSAVQARGFLRMYAEYLGLDSERMLRLWENPDGESTSTAVPAKAESRTQPQAKSNVYTQSTVSPDTAIYRQQSAYTPHSPMPPQMGQVLQSAKLFQPAQPAPIPAQPIQPVQPMPGQNAPAVQTQQTVIPTQPQPVQQTVTSEPQKPEKPKRRSIFGRKTAKPIEPEPPREDPIRKIFLNIGDSLKTRRVSLGLTLGDCESQTLIRSIYLELMESGDLEQLPSFIQGRGMLKNYATFLGLDTENVMLRYAEAIQLFSQEKARAALSSSSKNKEKARKPTKKAGKLQQFLTPDLFVGVFVILSMAVIVLYSVFTISDYRRSIANATPTMNLNEIFIEQLAEATDLPSFGPTATPTANMMLIRPTEGDTTAAESEEILANRPVQVFISANQRSYLYVEADGKEVFAGRTLPNNTYPFDAEKLIEITTGNAAAISVNYNQQNLGILGSLGEVMTIDFSPISAATPTPQFSPTPTNTLQPTYTPQPETPLPTLTPTPYIP